MARGTGSRQASHWTDRAIIAATVLALWSASSTTRAAATLDFSPAEIAAILRLGPWPPARVADPSNRVSDQAAAARFGEMLFFDRRLAGTAGVSCATCHDPERAFQDGRATAHGIAPGDRNTPTLLNTRFNRWFGWDGANDSLWAQSIRPLLDPREMGGSSAQVARRVRNDAALACAYRSAFRRAPGPPPDVAVLVDVGKALAAYQETLVSTATPFDHFRDALATGDASAASRYPIAAQRGLRLFIGSGNCVLCHFGPRFTNGEFADIGAPFFVPGGVDSGRHGGLARLLRSPFSRVGRFSDAPSAAAVSTRHVSAQPRNFGEFRVPSLREVARTAPYLHNGSLATLADVVRHYSELDLDRLHVHGEQILRPLRLSAEQAVDLVTFLETLSSEATTPRRISNDAGARCAVSVLHGNVE